MVKKKALKKLKMLLNSMCPIAMKFQKLLLWSHLQLAADDPKTMRWPCTLLTDAFVTSLSKALHKGKRVPTNPAIYHGSNLQAAWARKISQGSCEMLVHAPPARSPLKHFGVYLGIHSLARAGCEQFKLQNFDYFFE
jgi:hypothetical protein